MSEPQTSATTKKSSGISLGDLLVIVMATGATVAAVVITGHIAVGLAGAPIGQYTIPIQLVGTLVGCAAGTLYALLIAIVNRLASK